jgi:hypothetical protein
MYIEGGGEKMTSSDLVRLEIERVCVTSSPVAEKVSI